MKKANLSDYFSPEPTGTARVRYVGHRRRVGREGITFVRDDVATVPAAVAQRLCATNEFERVADPVPAAVPDPFVTEEESDDNG